MEKPTLESIFVEQKEKEVFDADLKVDFMRHGRAVYTE